MAKDHPEPCVTGEDGKGSEIEVTWLDSCVVDLDEATKGAEVQSLVPWGQKDFEYHPPEGEVVHEAPICFCDVTNTPYTIKWTGTYQPGKRKLFGTPEEPWANYYVFKLFDEVRGAILLIYVIVLILGWHLRFINIPSTFNFAGYGDSQDSFKLAISISVEIGMWTQILTMILTARSIKKLAPNKVYIVFEFLYHRLKGRNAKFLPIDRRSQAAQNCHLVSIFFFMYACNQALFAIWGDAATPHDVATLKVLPPILSGCYAGYCSAQGCCFTRSLFVVLCMKNILKIPPAESHGIRMIQQSFSMCGLVVRYTKDGTGLYIPLGEQVSPEQAANGGPQTRTGFALHKKAFIPIDFPFSHRGFRIKSGGYAKKGVYGGMKGGGKPGRVAIMDTSMLLPFLVMLVMWNASGIVWAATLIFEIGYALGTTCWYEWVYSFLIKYSAEHPELFDDNSRHLHEEAVRNSKTGNAKVKKGNGPADTATTDNSQQ